VNEHGSVAELSPGKNIVMPPNYYNQIVPSLLRKDPRTISPNQRNELEHFSSACRNNPALGDMLQQIFDRILPDSNNSATQQQSLEELLDQLGFDRIQHEQIKSDLRSGRIGLAQNRLPINTMILDAEKGDVFDSSDASSSRYASIGSDAIEAGMVAV